MLFSPESAPVLQEIAAGPDLVAPHAIDDLDVELRANGLLGLWHGLSGHGREGGLQAALDYTKVKSVWLRTSDDPIPDPFVMR